MGKFYIFFSVYQKPASWDYEYSSSNSTILEADYDGR